MGRGRSRGSRDGGWGGLHHVNMASPPLPHRHITLEYSLLSLLSLDYPLLEIIGQRDTIERRGNEFFSPTLDQANATLTFALVEFQPWCNYLTTLIFIDAPFLSALFSMAHRSTHFMTRRKQQ